MIGQTILGPVKIKISGRAKIMYPFNIPGIQKKRNYFVVLTNEVEIETVRRLILEIPAGCEVMFYDRNYPSPSDPGAFVTFRKKNSTYFFQRANHGWQTNWKSVKVDDLINYLWGCRSFNMGGESYEGIFVYYI